MWPAYAQHYVPRQAKKLEGTRERGSWEIKRDRKCVHGHRAQGDVLGAKQKVPRAQTFRSLILGRRTSAVVQACRVSPQLQLRSSAP